MIVGNSNSFPTVPNDDMSGVVRYCRHLDRILALMFLVELGMLFKDSIRDPDSVGAEIEGSKWSESLS